MAGMSKKQGSPKTGSTRVSPRKKADSSQTKRPRRTREETTTQILDAAEYLFARHDPCVGDRAADRRAGRRHPRPGTPVRRNEGRRTGRSGREGGSRPHAHDRRGSGRPHRVPAPLRQCAGGEGALSARGPLGAGRSRVRIAQRPHHDRAGDAQPSGGGQGIGRVPASDSPDHRPTHSPSGRRVACVRVGRRRRMARPDLRPGRRGS